MQFTKNNLGFSLVELVVVISIMAILGTISFLSFSQYLVDARNSDRVSDMGNMKISLRTSKQRTGAYPVPGSKIAIIYNSATGAYQGWFDQSLSINTLSQIPKDPKVDSQYYGYATSATRQNFQVAMTLEGDTNPKAYLDGDYKTVAKDILPSLITSSSGTLDVTAVAGAVRKTFIFNGGSANLAYDLSGKPKTNTVLDFTGITTEVGVSILESSDYTDCRGIYEAGKSLGAGTYRVSNGNGGLTATGCTMNPPTY